MAWSTVMLQLLCLCGLVAPTVTVSPPSIISEHVHSGSCLSGWSPFGNKCYKLFNEENLSHKTWRDAYEYCRSLGPSFDLVSIHSQAEQEFITKLMGQSIPWIGLNDRQTESRFHWTDNTEVTYTAWNRGEPNNFNSTEDCVDMYHRANGGWNDRECTLRSDFMCQTFKGLSGQAAPTVTVSPPSIISEHVFSGFCLSGWSRFGNKCYKLFNKENLSQKTWTDAYEYCRSLGPSFDLVSIHSQAEQEFITELMGQSITWIGLNDRQTKSRFRWTDNTEVTYTAWNAGEPNDLNSMEDCVDMFHEANGGWNDIVCTSLRDFMCQSSKGKPCADPGEEMNGNRISKNTFDGMFYSRSTITYSCNDLYYLSGTATITCLSSGKWNDKKPRCIRIPACTKLSEISNAIIRYSIPARRNPNSGHVAEFVEETSGPPSRIARLPDFAAASFPSSLTAISDEKEEMYNGPFPAGHYRAGARAIISCKSKFYKHIGSKIRTCRKTGVWSGTSTYCLPVCGVSSAPRATFIVNGNVSEAGQWPWQAGIARWLPKDEKYIILCGGSLIRQNWVLTAAHCVTFQGSKTVIPSSQFRIYLGKYYRDDSLDDEQVQMKVVSDIYVNQDYDAVVLDADIALVRLNEPAILTARVRPVCLPTLSSSNENLVEGAVGIVIGWGLNENDTYSEKLMQARTPFVSTKTCIDGYKSVGHPLTVTNYMYCAGYKEGKIDACSGDSGGPMVFKGSSTGRWTQEGIVSWGSPNGCGKTNQYGGYVRIEVFMNWIDQFL